MLKDLIPAATNQFKGRGCSFNFRFACVVAWEKQLIVIMACLSSDRRLLAVVVLKCKDLPVCRSADIPHYKKYEDSEGKG